MLEKVNEYLESCGFGPNNVSISYKTEKEEAFTSSVIPLRDDQMVHIKKMVDNKEFSSCEIMIFPRTNWYPKEKTDKIEVAIKKDYDKEIYKEKDPKKRDVSKVYVEVVAKKPSDLTAASAADKPPEEPPKDPEDPPKKP